MVQIFDKN